MRDDSDFHSDSIELQGHFVGISEIVGHAMTFKMLTGDTNKILHRSNVRPLMFLRQLTSKLTLKPFLTSSSPCATLMTPQPVTFILSLMKKMIHLLSSLQEGK